MLRKQLAGMCVAFLSVGWLLLPGMAAGEAVDTLIASRNLAFDLTTTPVTFAEEIFGSGSDEVSLGNVAVTLTVRPDTGVAVAGAGIIEYRLTGGAQFSSRQMDPNDLQFIEYDSDGALINISLASGGAPGDTGVAFRVVARDAGTDGNNEALEASDRFVLTIPGVRNLAVLGTATGSSSESIRVEIRTSVVTSSSTGQGFQRLAPLVNGMQGNIITENRLVQVANRFDLVADGGPAATISVSERDSFESGATAITLPSEDAERQGVVIGTLGITVANVAAGVDGVDPLDLIADDRLRIAVAGEFNEGALVFVDLNQDDVVDPGEIVSFEEGLTLGGTTSGGMSLLAGTVNVYFVTDGDVGLMPASYTVTFTLDFGSESFQDEFRTTLPTRVTFHGVVEDGFAYGIPNCTEMDRAHIRITNETSEEVTLFVSGLDNAGESLSEGLVEVDASEVREGETTLFPFETLVLYSQYIEELFGFNDGSYGPGLQCETDTWNGRAQLTFFSSGNITVTPLNLNSDGQLIGWGGYNGLMAEDGSTVTPISK